jgi:hypothetical protein
VFVDSHRRLDLTYCTNIHPADGWPAVLDNLSRYAPALKARCSPHAPFALGLRLSAREARELLDGHLNDFKRFLDREGLYVALINGFPHGSFHRSPVKEQVYAPDWRDPERVRYTLDLINILSALLPQEIDGGVSTAPLSYKAWMAADAGGGWETITRHVVDVAAALVRLRDRSGTIIHLDIEPEPDCSIENTDETIAFFTQWLLPRGAPQLAAATGRTIDQARSDLLNHVRICFDCCHFAVEFEDPADALSRLTAAGIRVGRIQLSSALRVHVPPDVTEESAAVARLRTFADPVYLHQVVARDDDARLRHFPDLPHALTQSTPSRNEWRIHFHVPLFVSQYEELDSTQEYVRAVLALAAQQTITTHLEIETYTWDVLPTALKRTLADSIAREYEWVLEAMRDVAPQGRPGPARR